MRGPHPALRATLSRKRERALAVAALLAASPLFAQTSDAERLMASALQSSQAWETLEHLTDDIGPRLSGSQNAAVAVDWTLKRFWSWGIDARAEKVIVPHWVRGVERAEVVAPRPQRLVLTALGGSVATPESGITAEVVELGSFEELPSANVKGKIVFFNVPMDMNLVRAGRSFEAYGKAVVYRGRGADRASAWGARAVLIRSVSSDSLRTPHTGAVTYDDKEAKIPAAALAAEDAMLLHRLLAQQQRVRLHLVLTPHTLPDSQSANVVAEIRGSERPDEIVLIGAHLDSWDLGTGAIDDASGVAMVMETMRLIKSAGVVPKRTIRCVLYMNEENGLRGGKQYAADHKNEKHIAVLESDAGTAAPVGFVTTLKGAELATLQQRARMLERVNSAKFESAEHAGADIGPLTDVGAAGFGLMPDQRHYFDYHHSPADTLDKIDPHELAQNTAAIAALTWVLSEEGVPSPEAGRGH